MTSDRSDNLRRFISPKSIVVIGGRECERVVEQSKKIGYGGEIFSVHPTRDSVFGVACVRSVSELPSPPDAAYVAVNRERCVDVVASLRELGCGGVVCYASGFSESGSEDSRGSVLERELVVASGSMPLVGPNCYGYVNAHSRVALWPDQHGLVPCESGVAIISQSSNIAINLTMQRRGLPVSMMMTVGNQSKTGLSSLGLSLLEQEHITAIGLYIEGLDDIELFGEFLVRARELNKGVVVLKVGRTEESRSAALTHTSSLAGSWTAHEALFRRYGVASVSDLSTFIETLKVLDCGGALRGNRIFSMSCSGGEAALMSDSSIGLDVTFPALTDSCRSGLSEILGNLVTLSNPLDYHTYIWGDWGRMEEMFSVALSNSSSSHDILLLVMDFPRSDRCDVDDWLRAKDAFVSAVKRCSGIRVGLVSGLMESLPESVSDELMSVGIIPLCGMRDSLVAISSASFVGSSWDSLSIPEIVCPAPPLSSSERVVLDEYESKVELSRFGVVIPRGIVVSMDDDDITQKVSSLSSPYVLKVLGISHKSDVGGVRLNLATPADVIASMTELSSLGDTSPKNFLVEEMCVGPSIELLVGIRRDSVCGLVLVLGAGGVLSELLTDTIDLLFPVSELDIRSALSRLRIHDLLLGYRGGISVDMNSVVSGIMCIVRYAESHISEIEELDVNPFMAFGFSSVAVDALIVKRGKE